MTNLLAPILKDKLTSSARYGTIDAETERNILKEELQYHVLNFICHHPDYGRWIMYGGSALRICHGLNRMSVDLDFEIHHPCTEDFFIALKTDTENYFANDYGLGAKELTIKITHNRGLTLRFSLGEEIGIAHPSKQIHVKIDVNYFIAKKTVTERIPINHDQLSFVITTYNMAALMASKITAIFQRGTRGVGTARYEEKGRDIYDLLWYMEKKIVPDLDYLNAKNITITDLPALFDRLTLKMEKVSDENLKQDLSPLFTDQRYIANWLEHWRESYQWLLKAYAICTVTELYDIVVFKDFSTDNIFFDYYYKTKGGAPVTFRYILGDRWMKYNEGDISVPVNENIIRVISPKVKVKITDRIKMYVTLFNNKNEEYLKKTNHAVLGEGITTKVIRMTADKFNWKEEIILNKEQLVACELEDLLK